MIEIWKEIEGFPKYKVSNMGRVKSCHGNEKILKLNHTNQYKRIQLWNNNKKRYDKAVHRLVLLAFKPNPDPDRFTICDHINRNSMDNRAENLRWSTNTLNNYNKSTTKGYYFDKNIKKWKAYIKIAGKNKHLGSFKYSIEARKAYLAAKKKLLKEIDQYHDY